VFNGHFFQAQNIDMIEELQEFDLPQSCDWELLLS
jgi:hypothetical protein